MDPTTTQTQPANVQSIPQYEPNFMGTLGFFAVFMVVFFLFIIKPQRNKEKARKLMLTTLKKGDRVMTNGGVFGRISETKEKYFLIKISNPDVKIQVSREYVTLAEQEDHGSGT
jgi:preprotein translocase subunit YajC